MAFTEKRELHRQEFESRSTEFSVNGITAKQSFTVPWVNRFSEGPQIGDIFPEEEGVPLRLFCSRVVARSIGLDDDGTEQAMMSVEYSSDQAGIWDVSDELDFAIRQDDIAVGRQWSSDGATNTQNVSVDLPVVTFTHTYSRPGKNIGLILAAVNTVNSISFLFGNPGTWKFTGARIAQSRAGLIPYQGGFVQEATFFQHTLSFEYNRLGWNNHWRTDTGAFDTFEEGVYDTFNHNLLLL